MNPRTTTRLPTTWHARLTLVSITSLALFALLALGVTHSQGPYGFENPVYGWLGTPASTHAWNDVAEAGGLPVIVAVVVLSVGFGVVRRASIRVVAYVAIGVLAYLVSDYLVKHLVQRYYYGELTFPSGNVTAVAAIGLAMWLALYPLFGHRLRASALILALAWIVLMALAVVGALWHTPVDDVGSVLLSVGIVCGASVVYERVTAIRVAHTRQHHTVTSCVAPQK